MVLGIKCILLDDGVSERQPPRWKHALYGMLSSGFVTMGYTPYISALFLSCFGLISALLWSLVCGRLLANLDSHVVILIIYLDVRDDTTICMSIYIYFFEHISSCSHLCPKRRMWWAQFERWGHVAGGLGAIHSVCRAWQAF